MNIGRTRIPVNGARVIRRARVRFGEKSTASPPNKLRQVRENIFQEQ
jgi:hypothetical protein